MTVTINGERRDIAEPTSVAELLGLLEVSTGRVAVEINEEVVPRVAFAARQLAAGDRIEVVHFVGGG